MVRIAISQAAFDAITKTLALSSVGFENKANETGERLVWLDKPVVDRLGAMRGPGESTATSSSGSPAKPASKRLTSVVKAD
jgi:hypothetical protein